MPSKQSTQSKGRPKKSHIVMSTSFSSSQRSVLTRPAGGGLPLRAREALLGKLLRTGCAQLRHDARASYQHVYLSAAGAQRLLLLLLVVETLALLGAPRLRFRVPLWMQLREPRVHARHLLLKAFQMLSRLALLLQAPERLHSAVHDGQVRLLGCFAAARQSFQQSLPVSDILCQIRALDPCFPTHVQQQHGEGVDEVNVDIGVGRDRVAHLAGQGLQRQ